MKKERYIVSTSNTVTNIMEFLIIYKHCVLIMVLKCQ